MWYKNQYFSQIDKNFVYTDKVYQVSIEWSPSDLAKPLICAHTSTFGNWCQSDQAQPRCKWVHSFASKHIELQSYLSTLIAS